LLACNTGKLDEEVLEWYDDPCCGVVLASGGYPGSYATGLPISGLDALGDSAVVFHAGTRLVDDKTVTAGGRVLTVVARSDTMAGARAKAYGAADQISFDGVHYRRDIAAREVI
jgi:phosphoribosylamine--glycine ligase